MSKTASYWEKERGNYGFYIWFALIFKPSDSVYCIKAMLVLWRRYSCTLLDCNFLNEKDSLPKCAIHKPIQVKWSEVEMAMNISLKVHPSLYAWHYRCHVFHSLASPASDPLTSWNILFSSSSSTPLQEHRFAYPASLSEWVKNQETRARGSMLLPEGGWTAVAF